MMKPSNKNQKPHNAAALSVITTPQMPNGDYVSVVKTIKDVILRSRYRAAQMVNHEMLVLYYGIGGFISQESRNARWGSDAIATISAMLKQELPELRGFSEGNIKKMRIFYEAWPLTSEHLTTVNRALPACNISSAEYQEITNRALATHDLFKIDSPEFINRSLLTNDLSQEDINAFMSIGFTHHYEIIKKSKSIDERLFYIRLCAKKFWKTEELRYHLKENLFKSDTIRATNFAQTIPDADYRQKAIQSFKDEYLIDLVDIKDPDLVDERVVEDAIVHNIKNFIMTIGTDFAFMGNQYRLNIGEEDFYVDLLFYHRRLRCLVAIELKRGKFHPEYVGKLNFYLSALDEYVKLPDENPSIGIILCCAKNDKVVEFAFRDTFKAMGVATYKTKQEFKARQEIEKQFLKMGEELRKLL